MLEIIGFTKYSEEDTPTQGCIPRSGANFHDDSVRFSEKSLEELVVAVCNFLGADTRDVAIEYDAVDEIGRLDITRMEDSDGCGASKRDVEHWKAGNMRLWDVTYVFRVERVTRKAVSLLELAKKEHIDA